MYLLLSTAAGVCTLLGALMLFVKRRWSDGELAFFLGLASGVMASVVVFDLLPSALIVYGGRGMLTGLIAGVLLTLAASVTTAGQQHDDLKGLGYLIMLAIALHDLPEGMAIALGGELKQRTAMVIALAIGIHNMPEGMAVAAPLLMSGSRRWGILWKIALMALVTPIGTLIGLAAVSRWPYCLPLFLGLASGVMGCLVWIRLWPEARMRSKKGAWLGGVAGLFVILLATFI